MASFEDFLERLAEELDATFAQGWRGLGGAPRAAARALVQSVRPQLAAFAHRVGWIGPERDPEPSAFNQLHKELQKWIRAEPLSALTGAGATPADLHDFREACSGLIMDTAFRLFGPHRSMVGSEPDEAVAPEPDEASPPAPTRGRGGSRGGGAGGRGASDDGIFDLGPTRGVRRRSRGGPVEDTVRVEEPAAEPTVGGRGGGTPPPGTEPANEPVAATLSASGPKELNVGQESEIKVKLERTDEAQPLGDARAEVVLPSAVDPVSVILTLQGEAVAMTDALLMQMAPPPAPGQPRELSFGIRGVGAGTGTAVLHFQQGVTPLAQLTLSISVVGAGAGDELQGAEAEAAAPDPRDDQVLSLIVQPPKGEDAFYTYLVTSELLGLRHEKFTSPVFELGGRSASEAPLAYAQSVFETIESHVLERWDDARMLSHRLKGVGADMCRQLLPAELIRQMWDQREQIDTIEITSFEPYIPWEVLRLKHPGIDGAAGIDDRHLAEYRLVRTLNGRFPAKRLGRSNWRCVLAEYPNKRYDEPTGERDFLTHDLPGRGIPVEPIRPDPLDVVEAMEDPDFDVVHIACHGLASLTDIEGSRLILSDRKARDGTLEDVSLLPADLSAGANLMTRRPLVFLNACQSGRLGPSLTDLGGWPSTFIRAGAGAMVGTSWSVHEGPAVEFATAFYDTLLGGDTLAEAAGAGRAAIKGKGASWLAYTVYGLPNARMEAGGADTD